MKKRSVTVVTLVLALVLCLAPSASASAFSLWGNETRLWYNQRLNGTTIISGKYIVNNGVTVTIPSNSTVIIKDGGELSVEGTLKIDGKVVVENGGRFFRKEYGIYQQIVGPKEDVGRGYTPLLASYIGNVEVKRNGFNIPRGSVVHVARSSVRLWGETWTMEHESHLTYDDKVSVNVTIKGSNMTTDGSQYARIVYGFGSCNTETHAITPNTYYWVYNPQTQSASWIKFDGLAALSGDASMGSEELMLWANTFQNNARMKEPALTESEATSYINQVYDSTRSVRNTYNLFIPTSVKPGQPVSLILFTHGGSWTGGTKEDMDYMCARFARLGYITADIDYRLYNYKEGSPATCMDDIMDDMVRCVNAINAQVTAMGYKIDKMATSGYSAGGHLALLYAYSKADATSIPVSLCFEQVGPASFTPEAFAPGIFQSNLVMNTFAKMIVPNYDKLSDADKKTALAKISPVSYINAKTVPTVMSYAGQDVIVGYNHGVILDQMLTSNGVRHTFYTMPKSNHTCEYDSDIVDAYMATSVQYCSEYLSSSK